MVKLNYKSALFLALMLSTSSVAAYAQSSGASAVFNEKLINSVITAHNTKIEELSGQNAALGKAIAQHMRNGTPYDSELAEIELNNAHINGVIGDLKHELALMRSEFDSFMDGKSLSLFAGKSWDGQDVLSTAKNTQDILFSPESFLNATEYAEYAPKIAAYDKLTEAVRSYQSIASRGHEIERTVPFLAQFLETAATFPIDTDAVNALVAFLRNNNDVFAANQLTLIFSKIDPANGVQKALFDVLEKGSNTAATNFMMASEYYQHFQYSLYSQAFSLYQQAVNTYAAAIKNTPESDIVMQYMTQQESQLKDYADAVNKLEIAAEKEPLIINPPIDATDTSVRFNDTINQGNQNTGTQAYTVKIDGRPMTLFVNYTTGNVVGYGYTGIGGSGIAPLGASGMDYAQGVFVGQLNADKTQIIGEFSGITGASAFDNKFHTISVPGGDATSVRILNLPRGAYTNGGSGSIETHIAIGVLGSGVTRTLSYTTSQGATDPYKLGNGYNLNGASTGVPVTYEGYGRILVQNRVSDAIAAPIEMENLGDLKVTVNSAKGSEDVTFEFNGSNPQATATKAVVNDRIAGAVSHLTDNVLRTGVMFPLENYNDVNLVHFMDYSEGLNNATPNGVGYGFGVVGKPTQVADLPTGTATYTGGAAGYITTQANYAAGQISDLQQFYGNTTLNVNFGTNAVTGMINTFKNSDNSAIDSFAVTGNVTGNGLAIGLAGNGTGTGTGSFFGPAGNEVGGQFSTTYTGTVSPNGIVSYPGVLTHDGVFWGAR